LVLAVATGVAGHLRTMGIETELTRSGDEAASTADRLRQAVGSGCRLLVSLHLEAGPSTSTAAQVRLYHRRDDGQAAMMSTRLAQSLAARLGAPPGIEAIVNHPLFGAPGTVLVLSLGSLTDPGIFERVRSTEFTLAVAEATAAAVR
jgi:N-acetylmuramoyl-L-alanine amidase